MELKDLIPVVIYDNRCYLCVKFVKLVHFLSREKITIVGHYSVTGEQIREKILDESALEMFWLVDNKMAYGGRSALLPLLKTIFTAKKRIMNNEKINESCDIKCKTVKSVFIRSASLFTNSRRIELK